MNYLWTEPAIETITKANHIDSFGNPTVDSILSTTQFELWEKLMEHKSLSYSILEKCGLCKGVPKPVAPKPKPKPKPKQKAIVVKARPTKPKPKPKPKQTAPKQTEPVYRWSTDGVNLVNLFGTSNRFNAPVPGQTFSNQDLETWKELANDTSATFESIKANSLIA